VAHYLITGHTGFKGAWLIFLLKARGHEVSGLALDPLPGSLFERADLAQDLTHDFRVDIRDREKTHKAFQEVQPGYVIHMAAQALVREGYRNPLYTYETNVNGTLNVLHAIEQTESIRAQLIVTTDKVYLNQGLNRPYVETDSLGGADPYSASKAMADILAQEWLGRAGAKPGAIARAGNVIGAGDISRDRLIPDISRAALSGNKLQVRYPHAVRPWQHVLDCLNGYLALLDEADRGLEAGAWNFGPDAAEGLSVLDVVIAGIECGLDFSYRIEADPQDWSETQVLLLDVSKVTRHFGPLTKMSGREALSLTFSGSLKVKNSELRDLVEEQVLSFESVNS
jgi:CDP-glucose 4,6-dehydratase